MKKILKKYFTTLAYFFSYLRYRILVIFLLSVGVGVLDGLGLSLFLPLLKMVDGQAKGGEDMGKMQFLVDGINSLGIPLTLMSVLVFLLFFFTAKGVVKYFSEAYKVTVLQWFIKRIRLNHLKSLNELSYTYFVKSDVGRIQNTMTTEVERVVQAFRNYFNALQFIVLVAVYTAFAFYVDWKFAILVSIGGGLTNFLFKRIYKKTKGASRELSGGNSHYQGLVIQQIGNYKYLKATGNLYRYSRKLKSAILDVQSSNLTIGKLKSLMNALREPIMIGVIVLMIYIQTQLMGAELGPILISLLFFYRALTYLMQMQVLYNNYLATAGSLENTQAFEQELRAQKEKQNGEDFDENLKSIRLKNINFSYSSDAHVLNDINLSIKNKETIAFVGESGSGKTTLVNLIAGLLKYDSGEYLLNGKSFKSFKLNQFQSRIGYITQDPVIFNDTVFNNVTFWDQKSPKNTERFERALQQASIVDYVNSLQDREDEILGNNGVNLSGGQRQRISIARELYKNTELLILDEATSALDSETEKNIQRNIENLQGQYTILIIAHRISTIKNADRIVLMDRGKISDVGSFEELTAKSKHFSKLVELQEL